MLVAVGMAAGRSFREGFAAFAVAFGWWDIFFYVFLRIFLNWPSSLLTWDLLFLLPVPWSGPVLAPVIVSLSMIGGGSAALWRECAGRPLRVSAAHWASIVVGGLVIIISFCLDFRTVSGGGVPDRFAWGVFAAGEALGAASFLHAWLRSPATIPGYRR
jgi:hypothetical protein